MEASRRKSRWPRRLLVLFVFALSLFIYSRQFHPEAEDVAGQRARLGNRERVDKPLRIDALSLVGAIDAADAAQLRKRG